MPNISLNEDIAATKELIYRQVFSGNTQIEELPTYPYQKVFPGTNENLCYLEDHLLDGMKSALSVLSSGDQIFTLVYHGIKDISSFDTNRLTYYYSLGIKRAAILTYDYDEYLNFMENLFSTNFLLDELTAVVKKLFSNMEKDCVSFWKEILDYNYEIQKGLGTNINLVLMLLKNRHGLTPYNIILPHTETPDAYKKCQNKLGQANITFENINCLDLSERIKGRYDVIFLSNIFDYFYQYLGKHWTVDKLLRFSNGLKNHLNDNGILFLAYIFSLMEFKTYKNPVIDYSAIGISELKMSFNVTSFPQYEFGSLSNITEDGMVLVRKRSQYKGW